jgi:hypothetical protein
LHEADVGKAGFACPCASDFDRRFVAINAQNPLSLADKPRGHERHVATPRNLCRARA